MNTKTEKHYLFEVECNWVTGTTGVLHAADAEGIINVGTPVAFGGKGKPWTPEHLFLSSMCSCFMSTYLSIMQKVGLSIVHLECSAVGQVKAVGGILKFSQVDLYPKIHIVSEILKSKATLVLEKTHKHCLVSNSVNATILYHSEVILQVQDMIAKNDLFELY